MASTANISAVTTANTFENWRIQTNLDTADINEVCRGDFFKPAGSINVAVGYIEISNTTGGFVGLRIPYGDATVSSGKMTAAKIDQIGSGGFIYAATTDIRFTNDALTFHAMGNTRTVRLFSNVLATLANVNASGFIETTGLYSNNGVILNVANFLTVSNTVRLGNVAISSNLSVSRNVSVTGNISIGSFANVAGSLNVGSTLEARGNTFLYSNLAVSSNATISGNVSIGSRANVGGTLNVGSTLEVRGNTFLYSNLAVSTNATIAGNVSIGSRANIVGTVNVGSTLEVRGNTALYANLAVSQNAVVSGNVSIGSRLNVATTLDVGGQTTLQSFRVMDHLANDNIGLAGTRRIYYFPKASFASAKLLIEVQSNDASFTPNTPATQISEGVVAHVNDNAYMTIYGTVSSPPASSEGSSLLGTFSSGVVGANVEIYLTTTYNNCLTKVVADLIK